MSDFTTKYDNYIFDLYGTLIDIRTDEHRDETWERYIAFLDAENVKHPDLATFRQEFFDADHAYRCKPSPFAHPEIDILEVYDELFTKYGNEPMSLGRLWDLSYGFRVASRDYMQLFSGLWEFLVRLKDNGKHIYILSNAQASYTVPEIKHFGLDRIMDDVLISSDYKSMKPEKYFFDSLINLHQMDRSRTVMLGDSYENDYEGALNAGISGVWLNGETDPHHFYLDNI